MTGSHSSSGLGDAIKKGVGLVHGTGEAIRGNFNATVDQASGDRLGVEKNHAIASKGATEIDQGYHRTGHGAGVTPADTERERLNTGGMSTNYGSHSTNTANKLDPRFDSDMDHRGTATGSTNNGTHTTNTANKLDPRFDSDMDHRADQRCSCSTSQTDGAGSADGEVQQSHGPHWTHTHRGLVSDCPELEPAQKLDPILSPEIKSAKNCPESTNVDGRTEWFVEKTLSPRELTFPRFNADSFLSVLDPKASSSHDAGAAATSQQSHLARRSSSRALFRRDTEPKMGANTVVKEEAQTSHGPESDDELHRPARRADSTHQARHPSHAANLLDTGVETDAPLGEPHPTRNPRAFGFLNLLDPRVDRATSQTKSKE